LLAHCVSFEISKKKKRLGGIKRNKAEKNIVEMKRKEKNKKVICKVK